MFIKKVFQKNEPFLANLYYNIQEYTHCVLNNPKNFLIYFFAYEYPKKCLRMLLYTYIHVNPFNFLKKYGNHCTLIGSIRAGEGKDAG